jgi:hypothetical protein
LGDGEDRRGSLVRMREPKTKRSDHVKLQDLKRETVCGQGQDGQTGYSQHLPLSLALKGSIGLNATTELNTTISPGFI